MTLVERIEIVERDYPDPMTKKQLADAIGLKASATHRLVREGAIPYEEYCDRLGRYHMFKRSDVIDFLRRRFAHASEA